MRDRTSEWIVAASCCEGPAPHATFADLPREHQREMMRFAVTAAASTAFFIAVAIIARPLPSRSMAAGATLPTLTAPRDLLPRHPPLREPPPRELRASVRYQLASVHSTRSRLERRVVIAERQEQRRNLFSRFFRSVIRSFQPDARTIDVSS